MQGCGPAGYSWSLPPAERASWRYAPGFPRPGQYLPFGDSAHPQGEEQGRRTWLLSKGKQAVSSASSCCPSLRKDPTGRKEKAMAAGLLPWGAQFQESATLKDVCGFHLGRVDSSSLRSKEVVWEQDTGELQERALAGASPFQTRCDFSAGVRRTEPDA